MNISEIISNIKNIEKLKEFFKEKEVIIFNRYLKSSIMEICELYGTDDALLITYEVRNIKENNRDASFVLVLDVWSRKSIEETDEIYAILMESLQGTSVGCYFNTDNISEYIEDELYYRKNIKLNYTLYK